MSDLISRSALLKKIAEEYDLNYGEILINPERFYEMVETVPTAYDVEKVVAELEEQAEQYSRRALELVDKSTEAGIHNKGKACSYEHAIDIVRKGGVE